MFNLDDGKNYVVTSGLRAGDRIVVEGVATLKDGAKIKAITPAEAAARLNALSGAAVRRSAAGQHKNSYMDRIRCKRYEAR